MTGDLEFYKLSGAGNDFIALIEQPEQEPAELARLLCRRGLSIGADGLFVLERGAQAGTVTMHHWNADGGSAELCLNGTRCAARLAFTLGWQGGEDAEAQQLQIITGAGPVLAQQSHRGIRTQVPSPQPPVEMAFKLEDGVSLPGFTCSSGVPHVVRLLEEEAWKALDIDQEGAALRSHPSLGAAGANVNFLRLERDRASSGKLNKEPIEIRTFERGVEGETLACGTGAVASAAVLSQFNGSDRHVFATRGGFELEVSEVGGAWFLEGDARVVSHGKARAGALSRC